MPLLSAIRKFIDGLIAKGGKPVHKMSVSEYRSFSIELEKKCNKRVSGVVSKNIEIEGSNGIIPIRIYQPENKDTDAAIMYFFGGGFVSGNLDSQDYICRAIAKGTGTQLFSVAYRLAPENKFPKGLIDVFDASKWLFQNSVSYEINKHKIVLCGCSSGATLAALVARKITKINLPLLCQILICPCTDFSGIFPSRERNAQGYLLDKIDIEWHFNHYLPENIQCKRPDLSPLWENDLKGLPSTLIIGAEYCPFVDEDKAYATKLAKAGIDVKYSLYEGQIHAMILFNNTLIKVEKDPLNEIVKILNKKFLNLNYKFNQ